MEVSTAGLSKPVRELYPHPEFLAACRARDVPVTLASDALQGKRVTITGDNGGYLFALLPPAEYLLRFNLPGFTIVEQRVRVSLAETARVDVELRPALLRETLTVESDGVPVAASTSIGRNISATELQRLPGARVQPTGATVRYDSPGGERPRR